MVALSCGLLAANKVFFQVQKNWRYFQSVLRFQLVRYKNGEVVISIRYYITSFSLINLTESFKQHDNIGLLKKYYIGNTRLCRSEFSNAQKNDTQALENETSLKHGLAMKRLHAALSALLRIC